MKIRLPSLPCSELFSIALVGFLAMGALFSIDSVRSVLRIRAEDAADLQFCEQDPELMKKLGRIRDGQSRARLPSTAHASIPADK